MDELTRALRAAMTGSRRAEALADCVKQLKNWEVSMPAVEPLVLDFGLGSFRETGLIEFWIANEVAAGYCGKFLFLFDGQTCPMHHHKEKLETFYIVRGTVRMQYDGRTWDMKPGDVLRVEVGHAHQFSGVGSALILEVSKPCIVADNYFADQRIRVGGNHSRP